MKIIKKFITWPNILLIFVILISFFAHAYNMFNFPYFENDEGAYISQAWSFLTQGRLAPYTYWYDHAPLGWILIALWTFITGGFHTFGLAVESGRVFMLVIHLISTFLIFDIGRKLTKQPWAGTFAALIFSLSPLAVYFQRRVLLDNLMIFWVLSSYRILLSDKLTIIKTYFSALLLGIAVLTKENAIFFYPAFLYAIWKFFRREHWRFAMVSFVTVSFCVISSYAVYAIYKGEFLPPGIFGSNSAHVSLIGTLTDQLTRGNKSIFFSPTSDFVLNAIEWMKKDQIIIIVGAAATVVATALSISYTYFRIPAFFGVLFWIFLLRGGLVIDFYIIPLIPILALNIGMLLDYVIYFISFRKRKIYNLIGILIVLVICGVYATRQIGLYTNNETASQKAGLTWIKQNVSQDAVIAVDAFPLVDLWDSGYHNALWFWKLYKDPEIIRKVDGSWENIQYLMLSHEMVRTMEFQLSLKEDIIRSAFKNSENLAMFGPSESTYLDLNKYKSTNGDWIGIYKVNSEKDKVMSDSWRFYKKSFLKNYGQVIDPSTNITTSESQSYAMLRAVWMSDRNTFDEVWTWTKNHLQFRTQDKLFSWLWKDNRVADSGTASDADIDISLALLFAAKRWQEPLYEKEASDIIHDIWKNEVVKINNQFVLVSSANSSRKEGYLVNPSYFSPHAYHIFSQVDSTHPWNNLVQDTYKLLTDIQNSSNKEILIPNWILITPNGKSESAKAYIKDAADIYGYDAFRTYFRLYLSYLWFNDTQAKNILKIPGDFFISVYKSNKPIEATYQTNGKPASDYRDLSTILGALSAITVFDSSVSGKIFTETYDSGYNELGYWGDSGNYYNQNWAWFAESMQKNRLINIWQ
jgi:endo-1,4-beta-D-glucanase Y